MCSAFHQPASTTQPGARIPCLCIPHCTGFVTRRIVLRLFRVSHVLLLMMCNLDLANSLLVTKDIGSLDFQQKHGCIVNICFSIKHFHFYHCLF